uniref:CSN12-like protein n=1 Tax=Amphimedon queenslandica TaxID=400682 RepID=A0A1X7TVR0_AMPQE
MAALDQFLTKLIGLLKNVMELVALKDSHVFNADSYLSNIIKDDGQMPRKELLDEYNLLPFYDVALTVSTGNLYMFAKALEEHELDIAWQNTSEDEIDADEVECIIANLIDKGKIKGYISHNHQKLVVSKQNPFPSLSSF